MIKKIQNVLNKIEAKQFEKALKDIKKSL